MFLLLRPLLRLLLQLMNLVDFFRVRRSVGVCVCVCVRGKKVKMMSGYNNSG